MKENSDQTIPPSVTICGAGLVGSLLACMLGNKGLEVNVYEMRGDMRKLPELRGKSINLALSIRGLAGLRKAGIKIDELVRDHCIPMYGRRIHDLDGNQRVIPYGKENQCINSISRRQLNELLISHAESQPKVKVHFNHKLMDADVDKNQATFAFTNSDGQIETVTQTSQILVGADGAYSAMRHQLMRRARINFTQKYIEHGYMELCIEPTESGDFAMPPNYLHIWPRGQFMMIALPNCNRSFTLTLFMPFEQFEKLTNKQKLIAFFEKYFPDSIPLLGEEALIKTFFSSTAASLVSVNVSPMHYEDKALLIGDAAHAMVPFFGQGMNCGFEDCFVLNELLDNYGLDFEKAFKLYTKSRVPDCEVICEFAMYNYVEMRDLVNNYSFLLRKKLDNCLNWLLGERWIPLYSMVTFSQLRYSECLKRKKKQDEIIGSVLKAFLGIIIISSFSFIYSFF